MFLFLKWIHILAIISWMAGILYYYRLLIYHRENINNRDRCELLELMQFRLYRYITAPAMGISILAGFGMIVFVPGFLAMPWLHLKLVSVIMLISATVHGKKIARKLKEHHHNLEALPSSKKLRILNEVPTLLMAIIVALVLFKPFS